MKQSKTIKPKPKSISSTFQQLRVMVKLITINIWVKHLCNESGCFKGGAVTKKFENCCIMH